MASNLHPGIESDTSVFATPGLTPVTMAQAMEAAFLAQWTNFNGDLPVPNEEKLKPVRLFFVAVAQGVVQHLRDNPTAFEVEVDSGGTTLSGEVVEVNTTGTTS
jgi:hypothetical protein